MMKRKRAKMINRQRRPPSSQGSLTGRWSKSKDSIPPSSPLWAGQPNLNRFLFRHLVAARSARRKKKKTSSMQTKALHSPSSVHARIPLTSWFQTRKPQSRQCRRWKVEPLSAMVRRTSEAYLRMQQTLHGNEHSDPT